MKIYTDGGSLNNPGEAAYAYVIYFDGKVLFEKGERIGVATNNTAEYTGLMKALEKVKEIITTPERLSINRISFISDSELMVKQLNGLYRVKSPEIRQNIFKIRGLENEINIPITYTHTLREGNQVADGLVKKALGR